MISFYCRLWHFHLPVVASSDDDIQLLATFTKELTEALTDGYRIEVAVELAVSSKFEAGDEQQKLCQLDMRILVHEQPGKLSQRVHVAPFFQR